jgi:type VI secretion system protein ImpA
MLDALDAVSQEKFGDVAPSYRPLNEALQQLQLVVRAILVKRLPPEPDPTLAAAEGEAAEVASGNGAGAVAGGRLGRLRGGPSVAELAAAEVRAGRPARAIELLMTAAQRGRSRRDRFVRRTAVARIMVDVGLYPVAVPVLEQLASEVDEFKLEEWERGEIVATPLALLWRCYDRTGASESYKEKLYLRICRLDPVQAIGLTSGGG